MKRRSQVLDRLDSGGQALTEFTLVIPIMLVLVIAVFELGMAMIANVGVNRAAQSGAHMASIAGNVEGADCLILEEVESSLTAPNDRAAIESVEISLTDLEGDTTLASNRWTRTGSTDCMLSNGETLTVPYSAQVIGYPNDQRCNVLGGCPHLTPARSALDSIGVRVRYAYTWITPLGGLAPLVSGEADGWTFEQLNIFRMEPHL